MQLWMSFARTPPPEGTAPVWTALNDEQRAEIVAMLARLIAKAAAAGHERGVDVDEDNHDE